VGLSESDLIEVYGNEDEDRGTLADLMSGKRERRRIGGKRDRKKRVDWRKRRKEDLADARRYAMTRQTHGRNRQSGGGGLFSAASEYSDYGNFNDKIKMIKQLENRQARTFKRIVHRQDFIFVDAKVDGDSPGIDMIRGRGKREVLKKKKEKQKESFKSFGLKSVKFRQMKRRGSLRRKKQRVVSLYQMLGERGKGMHATQRCSPFLAERFSSAVDRYVTKHDGECCGVIGDTSFAVWDLENARGGMCALSAAAESIQHIKKELKKEMDPELRALHLVVSISALTEKQMLHSRSGICQMPNPRSTLRKSIVKKKHSRGLSEFVFHMCERLAACDLSVVETLIDEKVVSIVIRNSYELQPFTDLCIGGRNRIFYRVFDSN